MMRVKTRQGVFPRMHGQVMGGVLHGSKRPSAMPSTCRCYGLNNQLFH